MNIWVGFFLFVCMVDSVGFWLLRKQEMTKQH